MPDPCEGVNCEDAPWCPQCGACDPPGGGGLTAPAGNGKAELGMGGTFYSWENGKQYSCRIDQLSDDGLTAGVTTFLAGGGQLWRPGMPVVGGQQPKKLNRTVHKYMEEREEYLEIVGRHMHSFGEAYKASGKPLPKGGFVSEGGPIGIYLPPRMEGHDCPAMVLKYDGGSVDLHLFYASGNGWSITRGVWPLASHAAVVAEKAVRAAYVAMRKPYWDAAQTEWASHAY